MTAAGTLIATDASPGVSWEEIVQIAIANDGVAWADDGCAAFVWGVTNLAGLPFFDLQDLTVLGDPTRPQNVNYVVPHSPGLYSGTNDQGGDGWVSITAPSDVEGLKAVLQPGDVVRVYAAGNAGEDTNFAGGFGAHSFIVTAVNGTEVTVADNWNGSTISIHSLDDITAAFAPGGSFQSVFVSRIEPTYVASEVPMTLEGAGFGDFSSLAPDAPTDASVPTIVTTGGRITEGAGNLVFGIYLSEPATSTFSIPYRLLGGSATPEVDFNADEGTLFFSPGESFETISVSISSFYNDSVAELDESVILELGLPTSGAAILPGGARIWQEVGWILDNDGTSEPIAVHVTNPLIVEGDGATRSAAFQISLSRPLASDLVVPYAIVAGSARDGSDIIAETGSLTFLAGQDSTTLEATIVGDTTLEGLEDFGLVLDLPEGLSAAGGGIARIVDDDASVPTIVTTGGRITEGAGNLVFGIYLSEPATSTFSIPYRLLGGSATPEVDFNADEGTLFFSPGESFETISVSISSFYNDSVAELDESVILELGLPTSGAAILPGGARIWQEVGWILDNDGTSEPIAVHVTNPLIVEGDGATRSAAFQISLSRPLASDLVVPYAIVAGSARDGSDIIAETGSLTFLAGQDSTTLEATIVGDTTLEGLEDFGLVLDLPEGLSAAGGGIARIVDDDASVPTIVTTGGRITEGAGNLVFGIYLSEPATSTFSIPYRLLGGSATPEVDFNADEGTLFFSPGESFETISVSISSFYNDSVAELDESVILELGLPTSGAAILPGGARIWQEVGWILDNDGTSEPIAVHVTNPLIVEGDGATRSAAFQISLSRPLASDLVVPYAIVAGSARDGSDIIAETGSLTFLAGQGQHDAGSHDRRRYDARGAGGLRPGAGPARGSVGRGRWDCPHRGRRCLCPDDRDHGRAHHGGRGEPRLRHLPERTRDQHVLDPLPSPWRIGDPGGGLQRRRRHALLLPGGELRDDLSEHLELLQRQRRRARRERDPRAGAADQRGRHPPGRSAYLAGGRVDPRQRWDIRAHRGSRHEPADRGGRWCDTIGGLPDQPVSAARE